MTWDRRDRIKIWTKSAVDVARFWRGSRIRHLAAVRREARNRRRGAVRRMVKSHEVLVRRDPEELEIALPWLDEAAGEDPYCGEVWALRGEILCGSAASRWAGLLLEDCMRQVRAGTLRRVAVRVLAGRRRPLFFERAGEGTDA